MAIDLGVCKKSNYLNIIIVLLYIAISLSGCVTLNDPEVSQEYNTDPVGLIDSQSTIGQTFISQRARLNGVTLWLSLPNQNSNVPNQVGPIPILFQLFNNLSDDQPVFTSTIYPTASTSSTPISIKIPNNNNPSGQSFYLELSTNTGSIQVNGRSEDAYPSGTAYRNRSEIDADLAFRVSYDYDFMAFLQDLGHWSRNIFLLFPLAIVLWLPGWLLLDFSGIHNKFGNIESLGLSIGLSVAIIPLVILWTTTLHLSWTRESILIISIILVTIFIGRLAYKFRGKKLELRKNDEPGSSNILEHHDHRSASFYPIALMSVFLATLAIRLIMIRDLATPAWVDPVHHALLTRLIMLSGGYPADYQPFLDLAPTQYHLGFHAIAAVFTWLTNLRIDQSLLILGQVINALMVFSVYYFALLITQRKATSLVAAVITGFMTPMPAYYTSWGRYTELTGLLIIPTAFGLVFSLVKENSYKKSTMIVILGAVACAGLIMVHYRVTLFLAALFLAYLITYLLIPEPMCAGRRKYVLLLLIFVAGLSLFFVAPWLYQSIKIAVLPKVIVTSSGKIPFFQDFSWAFLTAALGRQTLVLAGLGLLWSILKGQRFPWMLISWIFILFFFANLGALKLPGGSLVTSSSAEIMLFIPISILGGYIIDNLISMWRDLLPGKFHIPYFAASTIIICLIAYLGAKQLVSIINPITVLSRRADIPAISWVENNIPETEKIVINPFAWGYGIYAGSDGGYWIAPLAGRITLPPPVLYGLGNQVKSINNLTQNMLNLNADPVAFRNYLLENNIQYVYTGAKGGVISPKKLNNSGLFTTLYHTDGVWIFQVKP